MGKSLLLWGAPHRVSEPGNFRTAITESGQNFGNLLIGHGVRAVLGSTPTLERSQLASPREAEERCSHIVVPASNFLWKDFDFGFMIDFIEKSRLPVTMIGVGAQTNDRTMSSSIHPNTLRLMKLVSERSRSIGVRGYYTAEVLAAHGIHNISVIGCPSLYSRCVPSIRVDRDRLQKIERLAVNLSRRVNRHSFHPERMRALENVVLTLAQSRDSTFIAQDEIEELACAADQTACPAQITTYFDALDAARVSEYFKTRTRYFADVNAWSSFIASQDASIGTRFHGNLIALINGVPALMIIHDSRTMEMCTLMGIPNVHVSEVAATHPSVEGLTERLQAARFDLFESSYACLYRRFVAFLEANGLPHNLGDA